MEAQRFAVLIDVCGTNGFDLALALGAVAKACKAASSIPSSVGVAVCGGKNERYVLDFDSGEARRLTDATRRRYVDHDECEYWVIVRDRKVEDILRGRLSPLQALLDGDLRVNGSDAPLSHLLAHLSKDPTALVSLCREDWNHA